MGGEKAVIFPIHLEIPGHGSPKDIWIVPHYFKFEAPIAPHFVTYKAPKNLFYFYFIPAPLLWHVSTRQQSKDASAAAAVMQNEGS